MAGVRWCEICKKPIESERAESFSDTRLCHKHAVEIESYGGEFRTSAAQERTSNADSLNLNHGGVTTTWARSA